MTEDEARTKACCGAPAVFAALLILRPDTEIENAAQVGKCLGSLCMAWRWRVSAVEPEHSHMAIYPQPRTRYETSATDGRCGLAGVQ